MFRAGQKVVCVDPDSGVGQWPSRGTPVKGQIYTVRDTGTTRLGWPGIRLQELDFTSDPGHCGAITHKPLKDEFYNRSRFRPVVERKTDISMLQALLNPANHTETV